MQVAVHGTELLAEAKLMGRPRHLKGFLDGKCRYIVATL